LSSLLDLLISQIQERGPMPFAAFMSQALYHPRYGYYTAGRERVGWSGHYLTSPELDPAFGELWANGFEEVWELARRPPLFEVVEIGPGEASFAAAVLHSARGAFGRALSYRLVERSERAEARQRAALGDTGRVAWSRSITDVPEVAHGCVFANEVLDNLPVHLVERGAGGLKEVCVTVGPDGLETALLPPSSPHLELSLERLGVELPEGHRMEIPLAAVSFLRRAATVVTRGAVVVVDYGAEASDLVHRPAGTLVCYSGAGVDDLPLDRPGEKDITCHANWTMTRQVLEEEGLDVARPLPQELVLRRLGLTRLDEDLRAAFTSATATGRGADAVAALSRRQALGALTDPGGLGGLEVVGACREIERPSFLA